MRPPAATKKVYRWQTMPSRERDDEIAMRVGRAVSYDYMSPQWHQPPDEFGDVPTMVSSTH
jgi:hypothetical protein